MNGSRSVSLLTASALIISAMMLTGCGLLARKAVEGATGVKVDQSQGSVTVQGKDGNSATVQQGTLPTGFPVDFPVYSGTIKVGNRLQSTQGIVYQVSIETPDSAKTIADWYEAKLKATGWAIDARNDVSTGGKDVSTVSAKNGSQTALIIAGTQSSGNLTAVNIQLQSK